MLAIRPLIKDADALARNISGAVVAKQEVVHLVVVSLLAGGHLLLEDAPGVGKTLIARSVAYSVDGRFARIQCTPDLLPSDITGSSLYRQAEGRFEFLPGPVFANIVLADEINRASPRTQSALLEAMAEGQVTAEGKSHPLPSPFWVVATQNEVDGYGTFPLPLAQLDRFMLSLSLGYPGLEEEVAILERNELGDPVVEPVLGTPRLREMQSEVRQIPVARPVREYIGRIVAGTRGHPQLAMGVSPRGGVHLQRASQALAAFYGDTFVAPEHVKAVAPAVLAHRIVPVASATLGRRDVVQEVLQRIPVPQ